MAENYLAVIDMQNDFVTGALGTAEARGIAEAVVKKVQEFRGQVVFTLDTHGTDYLNTQEGNLLPVKHCVKGTEGWELIPELEGFRREKGCQGYEKGTFGSLELAQFLEGKYRAGELGSVELVGVCTDICVVSNALLLKAHMPELPVAVDAACCAGVTPQRHRAALDTLESCQVLVKNRGDAGQGI